MGGRLAGKVALVTGAAQGIGAAIARAMAGEGAMVVATDIKLGALEAVAKDIGARAMAQDVTQEAGWHGIAGEIEKLHGRLDVLVHNAGIEIVKPISDLTLDEWRRLMAVNIDAIYMGSRIMQPLLIAATKTGKTASVINISSIAGLVGFPNQVAYNTSKGAVRHFTKSMAIEWTSHGHAIRCNSIHPGCIRTEMLERAVEDWVREGSLPADDPWTATAALCPLNKVGAPEDVAMGAVYLASDEAKFVTGAELVIDGGWVAR